MPGFCITNFSTEFELKNYDDSRCRKDGIWLDSWSVRRNTLEKFIGDKIFAETAEYFLLTEGVIYNFGDLAKEYQCKDYVETVTALIRKAGISFFERFRGSFSGAVYYKKEKKWIIYTGHLGEKAVFYYVKNGRLIAGSQLNYVTDCMKANWIERRPNVDALNQFMGYGYYLDDSTCVEDVKRLYPGEFLEFKEDEGARVVSYYKADYKQELHEPDDEIIRRYNDAFLRAMESVFRKDAEYGYKTLLDISGGADSRMICYAAKALQEENVLLDCYAQSSCLDAKIAADVANKLGYEYVFRNLDNAECMMHIDENILMNNGATIYYGITGGKSMLEMFDRNMIGMECTGLLGSANKGSIATNYCDAPVNQNYLRFRTTNTLEFGSDFMFPEGIENRFENHVNEHYWFYTRGMIFGMTSYFIRQNFVEVATPFGDPEFLSIYLGTPWERRTKDYLLRKWMIRYYPQAADIPHASTGVSIRRSITKSGQLEAYLRANFTHLFHQWMPGKPYGMNDVNYWYRTNERFRKYIDRYCEENYLYVVPYDGIKENLDKLLSSGKLVDKLIAVSVLSILKNYVK